jgi:hypothetical protein
MTQTNPSDGVPVLNVMIEDYLAHGETELDHAAMLHAWVLLGVEYLARAAGRQFTLNSLDNTRRFVRDAQPAKAWKP